MQMSKLMNKTENAEEILHLLCTELPQTHYIETTVHILKYWWYKGMYNNPGTHEISFPYYDFS